MFDLDQFIEGCRDAATEPEPWLAVRELLEEALSDRASIAGALPATRAELAPLYSGHDVTIVKVVWAPRMVFPPHDHLTWACNGIYGGAEHNRLYRLEEETIVECGELSLEEGQVGVLDEDAIHGVLNPRSTMLSAAIHVYGGDFLRLPRGNWTGDPPTRRPTDVEQTRAMFERANDGR
jgi:predicted metal-dependent enzyme (double-stranded beta helix superfamily)